MDVNLEISYSLLQQVQYDLLPCMCVYECSWAAKSYASCPFHGIMVPKWQPQYPSRLRNISSFNPYFIDADLRRAPRARRGNRIWQQPLIITLTSPQLELPWATQFCCLPHHSAPILNTTKPLVGGGSHPLSTSLQQLLLYIFVLLRPQNSFVFTTFRKGK